jgi:hypothetical protein
VALFGLLLGPARREPVVSDSPEALAELVRSRFATGSAEAFDSVYPDPSGRAVVRSAIAAKSTRRDDLAAVLRREAHSAIVLLAGTIEIVELRRRGQSDPRLLGTLPRRRLGGPLAAGREAADRRRERHPGSAARSRRDARARDRGR